MGTSGVMELTPALGTLTTSERMICHGVPTSGCHSSLRLGVVKPRGVKAWACDNSEREATTSAADSKNEVSLIA
jgi:hypothetical protein